MDVLKQFEELTNIEQAISHLKEVSIIPAKALIFFGFLCVCALLAMIGAVYFSFLFAFLALISIFGMLILLDSTDAFEKEDVLVFKSFDDLKAKIAQQTNLNQNELGLFLDYEQYAQKPITYSLELNKLEPFKNRAQELKAELLGEFDEASRQRIKTIATYLDKENRRKVHFKFETFKQLVAEFNEEIEAKGMDEETKKELKKAGVHSYQPAKKNDVTKIEIEE